MMSVRYLRYSCHRRRYASICCSLLPLVGLFIYYFSDIKIDPKIYRTANYTKLETGVHASKLLSTFRCHNRPIKLLVVVQSHAENFARRKVIRATWGKDKTSHKNDVFRTFFAVGRGKNYVTTK